MRRRGVTVLAGAAALAGALVIVAVVRRDRPAAAGESTEVELSTVEVTQQDVVTYEETAATLEFTASVTVPSPVAGTVTTIVAEGATIEPGTIVATVDGSPVVALIGDVPAWRDLSVSSSDGVDVRQLETNLVSLGFDPEAAIVIDEAYDEATADAVARWEEHLGLDADGEVPQDQLVFVPGRLLVDTVDVAAGGAATAGGTLLSARVAERQFPVSARSGAAVSNFAEADTDVVTGTILFRRGGLPVVAVEGDPAAVPTLGRDLTIGVDDGADVRLFEQMLATAGFDAEGAMVVDDHFDLGTATATLAWWQSVDPLITVAAEELVVPAGSFVTVPAGLRIAGPAVTDGTVLAGDAVVLGLTSPARVVSTSAPVGDETFSLGAAIDVEFPDGTVEPGTVVAVGNVASAGATPQETPTVTIDIDVAEIPSSVESFVSIPVTLRVVDEEVPSAYVVPVSALVALSEGGYALEAVTGEDAAGAPTTTLIAVETGLFSNGFVVVSGPDVAAGLDVVVPS